MATWKPCFSQILQEFFKNNAYPKDDDIEHLSKLLNLEKRVIEVWFKVARSKARKVYENQPAVDPSQGASDEAGANRIQRTPDSNYQCKKCLLVFQRLDELMRHQNTHCFKEEDARRSAQAQTAAAQVAAAVLGSEDSNSSTFGMLQQHEQLQQLNANLGELKLEEMKLTNQNNQVEGDMSDQLKENRLRTISPEMLDYLYQKYQIESRPSRKMLYNIAQEVGLEKRVVEVWFQVTRARERRKQLRVHAQVINKRCPFCSVLFKFKAPLQSHLIIEHAARGEVNIDALPDEDVKS